MQELEQLGDKALAAANDWEHMLLRLSFGRIDHTEVLARAGDPVARSQAQCFVGLRLATEKPD